MYFVTWFFSIYFPSPPKWLEAFWGNEVLGSSCPQSTEHKASQWQPLRPFASVWLADACEAARQGLRLSSTKRLVWEPAVSALCPGWSVGQINWNAFVIEIPVNTLFKYSGRRSAVISSLPGVWPQPSLFPTFEHKLLVYTLSFMLLCKNKNNPSR